MLSSLRNIFLFIIPQMQTLLFRRYILYKYFFLLILVILVLFLFLHSLIHQTHHHFPTFLLRFLLLNSLFYCSFTRKSTKPSQHLKYFICSHTTKIPQCNLVSFQQLPSHSKAFIASLLNTLEPTSYSKAAQHPIWTEAKDKEISALTENKTWDIVSLPHGKKPIGCKWVYRIKRKQMVLQIDIRQGCLPMVLSKNMGQTTEKLFHQLSRY